MAVRWYARPENRSLQLSVAPRLASWNKADDPDQVRLREYLDDTEALLADSRIDGPWALRLDIGLPTARDLLNAADLDNYAYPLAYRLRDSALVSVWCTKQHSEQSFVRIESARELPPPSTDVLVAKTTASASTKAYKEQIYAEVAGAEQLPEGPVRLELSFVVGPGRNWLNLWKQTIDALDPLLGRTYPHRAWHPRDGRITELGMHLAVDPAARNEIVVGINASPGRTSVSPQGRLDLNDKVLIGHPDLSARTERVLSTLTGRTDAIPPRCANDLTVGHNSTPDASRPRVGGLVDDEPLPELETGVLEPGAHEFRDDDVGYLSWLAAHANGFVINIARSHSAISARVHHAGCRTISGENPRGGVWTGPYEKVCAEQLADLEQWAVNHVGEPIRRCGTCH